MAQLIVRELEQSVADGLKKLSAEHGRSAEAEHREVLQLYVREQLGPKKRTFTDVLGAIPYFADDPDDLFEI